MRRLKVRKVKPLAEVTPVALIVRARGSWWVTFLLCEQTFPVSSNCADEFAVVIGEGGSLQVPAG